MRNQLCVRKSPTWRDESGDRMRVTEAEKFCLLVLPAIMGLNPPSFLLWIVFVSL